MTEEKTICRVQVDTSDIVDKLKEANQLAKKLRKVLREINNMQINVSVK